MARYLIDSDICIHHLRGRGESRELLSKSADIVLSFITVAEILQGASDKTELAKVQRFVEAYEMAWGNDRSNRLATDLLARYHLSHGLLLSDALQAAIALTFNYTFVTHNVKHFRDIAGLAVMTPQEVPEKEQN